MTHEVEGRVGRTDAGRASGTARRDLWLNSTLALAIASLVAVVLHESSHAVAGLLQDRPVVLYPFQVDFPGQRSSAQEIVTAATGPIFSLLLGLVVIAGTRHLGRGFGRLFFLWLGFICAQNFFGYLVIAPFGDVGDTGKVLALLGAPGFVSILCFLIGAVGTMWLSWLFLNQAMRHVRDLSGLRTISVLAWLAGTVLNVVRTVLEILPSSPSAGVIIVVMSGAVAAVIFAPLLTSMYQRVQVPYEQLELRRPVVPLVAFLVLLVLDLVFLARGITLD